MSPFTIGTFRTDVTMIECFGHAVLWFLITLCTLGIGVFFYPYALAKFIINRTYVEHEGTPRQRLVCDLDLAAQVGHALIWLLLSIVTFGLAYFLYLYGVGRYVAAHTRVESA